MRQMKQEQLADLTLMGRPTIASIEGGRQAVALHQALKLSEALGVGLGDLVAQAAPSALRDLHGQLADHDLLIVQQLREELS
jgi:transcriptional regulator with XRE-family HTH domain